MSRFRIGQILVGAVDLAAAVVAVKIAGPVLVAVVGETFAEVVGLAAVEIVVESSSVAALEDGHPSRVV